MRTNAAVKFAEKTHEGAPAARMTSEQALRRAVLSCFLWESEFYEDGQDIAARIADMSGKVPPAFLADLAVKARSEFNLRHAPLCLATQLAKHGHGAMVGDTIAAVIQRADELAEFLAIYWKAGKMPLAKQVKRGLAKAFLKFDEYALAKYNRDGAVKLRDALFLSHAKPDSPEREALWRRLVAGELATPDTWEVELSSGADKRATWERLIREGKLGYLALLRNLRNMEHAGVDSAIMRDAIVARKGAHRVLPFRYVAAARAAPQFEPYLDQALCETIAAMPPLPGKTVVLVDVSGSMDDRLSAKSDMTRRDAAATLASIVSGDLRVFAFADNMVEVPPRRGMAGVAAINSAPRGGTRLFDAIAAINARVPHDRMIVVTDEQAHPAQGFIRFGQIYEQSTIKTCPAPKGKGYMINVASAQNGVGYGNGWTHIDGFSESVLRFIVESEAHDGR